MKLTKLILTALLAALFTASCAAEPPAETTPPPEAPNPAATPVSAPTPSPPMTPPPEVPGEERRYLGLPYLVKLEPYIGGSYTDGINIFIFEDSGSVVINSPHGGQAVLKERETELPVAGVYDAEEFEAAFEKLNEHFEYGLYLGAEQHGARLVYADGGSYYIHINHTGGGGSGESYYHADGAYFLRVSGDEVVDYGAIGAVHIMHHGGYFYYVELTDGIVSTPGIGRVIRMEMDGGNKKTIVNEPVYGPFDIVNDRLYYSAVGDGKAYSVDLNGGGKAPVGERFAPDYHRVKLRFYGDMVISDFWCSSGYSFGIFAYANEYASPAIMDASGLNLLTFPAELCGVDAYEVVNWHSGEPDSSDKSYLFLKSNYDGSHWVYAKRELNFAHERYKWAKEQWDETAN
ncbi:MAG: hypothetical protein GX823_05095 [Clostridiales bacterium]|nr:hypothetical protein [Clostridiales bacterium]